MSRVVFILGAGASHGAGAPLMGEFLDASHTLFSASGDTRDREVLDRVEKGISLLTEVHSKAQFDLQNIESVFAAFEMARLFGRLGPIDDERELDQLTRSMRRLIVRTLEVRMNFPIRGNREVAAPGPYRHFGLLIGQLRAWLNTPTTILTFNYDIGLDFGLFKAQVKVRYGLEDLRSDDGDDHSVNLFKLHGSLNWLQCACPGVQVVSIPQLTSRGWPASSTGTQLRVPLEPCSKCGKEQDTLIVPPTWNKGEHYGSVRSVWRAAARHLSQADQVFIIGYSWPQSDAFFHQLWALGTAGRTLLRRLWIVDPNKSVILRFKEQLLQGQALARLEPKEQTFQEVLNELEEILGVSRYKRGHAL